MASICHPRLLTLAHRQGANDGWSLGHVSAVDKCRCGLQAYHIARARELNVDQPRNLAKAVTVE